MILTDTHTHLYYEADPVKLSELMRRSLDNQVNRLFLPNVDLESLAQVFSLAKDYPDNCFPMLGLHPCAVGPDFQAQLETIHKAINEHTIYAIGEIGIDLYWDKNTFEIQKEAFIIQINWGKKLGLPIVIHCRNAFNEVYEILSANKNDQLKGIFHCFSGTIEQARQITDLGFYLGIGGVVTYKNSGLDKVVSQLDLKHIVLETDAPYLTPVPYRGKPNESSYLLYIAQAVADLHQLPLEEVAYITTENSKKVFGI